MARIAGVNIPNEKKIAFSLPYIYGIGPTTARKILAEVNIDPEVRTKTLTEAQLQLLRDAIVKFKTEGDLRREILTNIKRLKEVACYRGMRHAKHLPVRGQRTKTNSRTVRGNVRKTMGSGRKAADQKT